MFEGDLLAGNAKLISKRITANLTVFGISHAIIDAACAALLFDFMYRKSVNSEAFAFLIVLYNVLAFSLQSPLGLLMDKMRKPVLSSVLGCSLTAIGVILFKFPFIAVLAAGIGNALFHVGGGMVSLNLRPGKAWPPGIYVAPGALGLLAGTIIGREGYFNAFPFIISIGMAVIAIMKVEIPEIDYNTEFKSRYDYFGIIIVLLLLSVAIRSLVGLALDYPWKANIYLLMLLTAAVFLGKALGGILADKIGWTRVSVGGLIICIPLVILGRDYPILVMLGMFLFNMTMPVTLTAISSMLPGRPGFSFGLTTLALIIGAMPVFAGYKEILNIRYIGAIVILISVFVLYKGLSLYSLDYLKAMDKNKSIGL